MSIRSEIDRISVAKGAIKSAIEAKGVTVPDTATLSDYAGKIAEIQSGGDGSLLKGIEPEIAIDAVSLGFAGVFLCMYETLIPMLHPSQIHSEFPPIYYGRGLSGDEFRIAGSDDFNAAIFMNNDILFMYNIDTREYEISQEFAREVSFYIDARLA